MINVEQLQIDPAISQTKIAEFIKNALKTSHQNGVVIAVSGGIDSAVALASSVKALGPDKVIAVTLPERDITPQTDVEDVMQLCEIFGVTCEHVEITPMLEVMRKNIPKFDPDDRVVYGNMKARLRMLLAYFYANKHKSMVIGTSNKTELYLGYFTKYGDGGVDIMPFADLYKCQVRTLGRHLGVPKCITEKPASARLWAGQDTEKDIGLPYDSMDLVVHTHLLGWESAKIAAETGVERRSVEGIISRIVANEHKRYPPAILRLS
jgi:NAD+ synthase